MSISERENERIALETALQSVERQRDTAIRLLAEIVAAGGYFSPASTPQSRVHAEATRLEERVQDFLAEMRRVAQLEKHE